MSENGELYFEEGVSCRYCYHQLTEEQKKSAQERHKQIQLAKERNTKHLGYKKPKFVKPMEVPLDHSNM